MRVHPASFLGIVTVSDGHAHQLMKRWCRRFKISRGALEEPTERLKNACLQFSFLSRLRAKNPVFPLQSWNREPFLAVAPIINTVALPLSRIGQMA
jgi:hypothetical protein